MKKKLYFENGKEAKIGDVVSFSKEENDPVLGKITTTIVTTITEDSVAPLIQMGVLCVDDIEQCPIPMDVSYYVRKVADKMGWKEEKTVNFLDNIDSIYPIAAFNIILREIAVELDEKYDDHISNSPLLFSISVLDGIICRVPKAKIKSYKHFAAFRTIEDAKTACRILSPILKELYAKE